MANKIHISFYWFLYLFLLSITIHRSDCKALESNESDNSIATVTADYSLADIFLKVGKYYLKLIDLQKYFQGSDERGLDLQYISTATKIIIKALWNKIYKCYSPHFLLDLMINEYYENTGTFLNSTMNMFKKSFQCVYKEAVDMMAALS